MKYNRDYSREEEPPAPVIEARLYDPLLENAISITAKLDTGFSGSILIGLKDYLKLGLQLYEEPAGLVSGRLATGAAVPLRASHGVMEVSHLRFECPVYCTPLLVKPLIGRELLNQWLTLLDGPRARLRISM